jgi:ribosomal protein S18 acetylase RimI-like enzyme
MNDAGISIRQFRFTDDYEQVISLWDGAGAGVHLGRSDTPEQITHKLHRDADLFLVAESDGQIVAAVLGGYDGRRGIVYHLAVLKDYRQTGVGARLMDELEQRLKTKGCVRCYLLVTRDNEGAIRFYENRGWKNLSDLYIYGKDLDGQG